MKAMIRAVAVATAIALPVSLQAQIDPSVQVNIVDGPRLTSATGVQYTGRTGGGFLADFVVQFSVTETASLSDWFVWCIDPFRPTGIPSSNIYALYSLSQFAATSFGSSGNDPDLADMNAIASQTTILEDDWASLSDTQRQDIQGVIWDRFSQVGASGGNESFDGADWYVLWNGEHQSFLTRIPERMIVPEPASLALLGGSLVGFVLVARRRRSA